MASQQRVFWELSLMGFVFVSLQYLVPLKVYIRIWHLHKLEKCLNSREFAGETYSIFCGFWNVPNLCWDAMTKEGFWKRWIIIQYLKNIYNNWLNVPSLYMLLVYKHATEGGYNSYFWAFVMSNNLSGEIMVVDRSKNICVNTFWRVLYNLDFAVRNIMLKPLYATCIINHRSSVCLFLMV